MSFRDHFWCYFCVILVSIGGIFMVVLASFCCHFGIWRHFCSHFGVTLVLGWVHFWESFCYHFCCHFDSFFDVILLALLSQLAASPPTFWLCCCTFHYLWSISETLYNIFDHFLSFPARGLKQLRHLAAKFIRQVYVLQAVFDILAWAYGHGLWFWPYLVRSEHFWIILSDFFLASRHVWCF